MRAKRFNCVLFALLATTCAAQDLTQASLEELMSIEVTSVSKKEQRLSRVAAAVHVITREDIRRSGAASVPEALRMAPGLHVAQIDSNKWAITARGFNGRFANKMLVLIDGRSVYTTLFSGTYWDAQDTLLEDVERIEVIRGPGATIWGANAVNGVINIITRNAADTQGTLITAGGGNRERGFGSVRHGNRLGARGHFRAYAKYADYTESVDSLGSGTGDAWRMLRGAFRADWELSGSDGLSVEGSLFQGRGHEIGNSPSLIPPYARRERLNVRPSGGHMLTKWTRRHAGGSDTALRFYFDRSFRDEGVIQARHNTFDFDLQHRLAVRGRHEVLVGAGERIISDSLSENFVAAFLPQTRTDTLSSTFAQDEIMLAENRLYFTLGTKVEHNSYTGFEVQPSGRLLWTPSSSHSLWLAASRAVRTPSRRDHDIRVSGAVLPGFNGYPLLVAIRGNHNFRSEALRAYEFGYRAQASGRISFDLATFVNSYQHLATYEPGAIGSEASPQPTHFLLPLVMGNELGGKTYGAEAAATLHAAARWKVNSSYTWLRMRLRPYAASLDQYSYQDQDASPQHQAQIRSYFDFSPTVSFDTALYRVGGLVIPRQLSAAHPIPAYTRVDVRLGWRATKELEVSAGARNLLDNRHPEFDPEALTLGAEVGRSAYVKFTWLF